LSWWFAEYQCFWLYVYDNDVNDMCVHDVCVCVCVYVCVCVCVCVYMMCVCVCVCVWAAWDLVCILAGGKFVILIETHQSREKNPWGRLLFEIFSIWRACRKRTSPRKQKNTNIILNTSLHTNMNIYVVATISRLLKIISLFCRIQSLLYGSFAKETYNFKEPTHRSHPISRYNITKQPMYAHTLFINMYQRNKQHTLYDDRWNPFLPKVSSFWVVSNCCLIFVDGHCVCIDLKFYMMYVDTHTHTRSHTTHARTHAHT